MPSPTSVAFKDMSNSAPMNRFVIIMNTAPVMLIAEFTVARL